MRENYRGRHRGLAGPSSEGPVGHPAEPAGRPPLTRSRVREAAARAGRHRAGPAPAASLGTRRPSRRVLAVALTLGVVSATATGYAVAETTLDTGATERATPGQGTSGQVSGESRQGQLDLTNTAFLGAATSADGAAATGVLDADSAIAAPSVTTTAELARMNGEESRLAREAATSDLRAAAAAEAARLAAEAARAAEAERAAREAARQSAIAAAVADPQGAARAMIGDYGWGDAQMSCLISLWQRESNWNYGARNPSSGAYGIPQALPASKLSSAGADWQTNPVTQIRWGLQYVQQRYGTPCGAWSFWQNHHWY